MTATVFHYTYLATALPRIALTLSGTAPGQTTDRVQGVGTRVEERSSFEVNTIRPVPLTPPRAALSRTPGAYPFEGQTVAVRVFKAQPLTSPVHEIKAVFEPATRASERHHRSHFDRATAHSCQWLLIACHCQPRQKAQQP